jgi:hypothetical protein
LDDLKKKASIWMDEQYLGLRWLQSRTRSGVIPTHRLSFKNQDKGGKQP